MSLTRKLFGERRETAPAGGRAGRNFSFMFATAIQRPIRANPANTLAYQQVLIGGNSAYRELACSDLCDTPLPERCRGPIARAGSAICLSGRIVVAASIGETRRFSGLQDTRVSSEQFHPWNYSLPQGKNVVLSCSRMQWLAPLNPAVLFYIAGLYRRHAPQGSSDLISASPSIL